MARLAIIFILEGIIKKILTMSRAPDLTASDTHQKLADLENIVN